ncbi:MAG: hypothetical protein ABSE90_06770 [Verrucomicrobiota bacterium]
MNQGAGIVFQKRCLLVEIPGFREGQQPKLREMIFVKSLFLVVLVLFPEPQRAETVLGVPSASVS